MSSGPRKDHPDGHYEVDDHPLATGLLTIYWVEPRVRTQQLSLPPDRLPKLGSAITAYLAKQGGEYERGWEEAVIAMSKMSPQERAEILSRARHPSGPDLRLMPAPGEAE